MLGTSVYGYEESGMFEGWPGTTPTPEAGWGNSARGDFRTGPSMRDEAPWELEGRGRPIWASLGSGLMGCPRVSPISGHTLAQA